MSTAEQARSHFEAGEFSKAHAAATAGLADALYAREPELPEGQLAKQRAAVVNTRALAGVARGLQLGRWIRLGRGEQVTAGRDKNSILADTMEALLGAVYLDRGVAVATAVVRRLFDPVMRAAAREGASLDWKTALQELGAARGLGVPAYLIEESGPAQKIVARSPRQLFWRRFRRDKVALTALVFIVLLIIVALSAPVIVSIAGTPG